MRAATPTEFAAVGLAITQGIGLWLAFAPSPNEVLINDVNDDEYRVALRHSELVIGGMCVATGGLGSIILKSPLPIVASVGIIAALAVAYEITLRIELVDGDAQLIEKDTHHD